MMDVQLRVSRGLYWISIVLFVVAAILVFSGTSARLLEPVALAAMLVAIALTFKPPLSIGLALAAPTGVFLVAWAISFPHWMKVALGAAVCAGLVWAYIARPFLNFES